MHPRRHVRQDGEYQTIVHLEYDDLLDGSPLDAAVRGRFSLSVSENVPHPIPIEIRDVEKKNHDADYVEFETRSVVVSDLSSYPVKINFTTRAATGPGSKWYCYRTADWETTSMEESKNNSEFIKHHIGIPSAQKIRLIARILTIERSDDEFEAGIADSASDLVTAINDIYDGQYAEERFSDDLKKYVSLEDKTTVQNFLTRETGFYRDYDETVNKIAKQLADKEYRYRVNTVEDVRQMVSYVNAQNEFPEITVDAVFKEVINRLDEDEFSTIANRLEIDDWSTVIDP